jgi:hypothetical protein
MSGEGIAYETAASTISSRSVRHAFTHLQAPLFKCNLFPCNELITGSTQPREYNWGATW